MSGMRKALSQRMNQRHPPLLLGGSVRSSSITYANFNEAFGGSSGHELNANDTDRNSCAEYLPCFGIAGACQAPAAKTAPPASYTVISPIFGQLVRFAMPPAFAPTSFEKTNGPSYIREAVLKGETVSAWTQMITVTRRERRRRRSASYAGEICGLDGGRVQESLPRHVRGKTVRRRKFGDQDGFVAVVGCGRIETSTDKHGETALIVTVKGAADYYTVQWAEGAQPSADKPAIDAAKWQERLRKLKPIRFCPIVPGEAMPYPSCVGKSQD